MISENRFFNNISEIISEVNNYKNIGHEQLFTLFVKERLAYTMELYEKSLMESVDYLSNTAAEKVFREVNYQQKKAYKEYQKQFDPKEIRKRLKEEAEGEKYKDDESDSRY